MQDHHLQKDILYKLVTNDSLRFSELRPKNIDSNVITYHLQQLIKQKLVTKTDSGQYALTELGKVAGINITLSKKELLEQAHSVILMALRDGDKWLLRKRKAQPMYDKVGFVHSEPTANEDSLVTAKKDFKSRTGLDANFEPKGFGYVKLIRGGNLESFIHFILFEATEYTGTLEEVLRNGVNYWQENPNFSSTEMIPSMSDMVKQMNKKDVFYFDKTYDISQ
jgi:DNA-binding HxlR family transcriptional regulator